MLVEDSLPTCSQTYGADLIVTNRHPKDADVVAARPELRDAPLEVCLFVEPSDGSSVAWVLGNGRVRHGRVRHGRLTRVKRSTSTPHSHVIVLAVRLITRHVSCAAVARRGARLSAVGAHVSQPARTRRFILAHRRLLNHDALRLLKRLGLLNHNPLGLLIRLRVRVRVRVEMTAVVPAGSTMATLQCVSRVTARGSTWQYAAMP